MANETIDLKEIASMLDHLREGVQLIDLDWTYRYVNEASARHGGMTVEQLVGHKVTERFPGVENTRIWEVLTRVRETGRPEDLTTEFTLPDGRVAWFDLRFQRVPQGIVVMSVDVTDQRETERNLQRAMRLEALGHLAGSVAHDFNNLLCVILGYASLLGTSVVPDLRADVQQIEGAAERAARLSAQLLAFARKKPVTPRAVDPARAVDDVIGMARPLLGPRITVSRAPTTARGTVFVDPGSLEQVLLNLFINARDAMAGSGSIVVDLRQIELTSAQERSRGEPVPAGVYTAISVTDTGAGMSPDVAARVFDPFFSTKGERGTGLGLASCYGLVRQAGGFLTVYSEVGRGSTFRVYLPVHDAAADAKMSTPASTFRGTGSVLAVDDDAAVLAIAMRSLRDVGFEVCGATSAAEALELLRSSTPFDVLLTDVTLGPTTGHALAQAARAAQPRIRVVLMSGYNSITRSVEDWIEKPFTPASLVERIRAAMSRPPAT